MFAAVIASAAEVDNDDNDPQLLLSVMECRVDGNSAYNTPRSKRDGDAFAFVVATSYPLYIVCTAV